MRLYLDESGNTGANWLDEEQPYYVYGGWLLSDEQYSLAERRINDIFSFSKAKELKSKDIFPNKIKYFYELMDAYLDDIHVIPIFTIFDKKYSIAAKVVETFFDCEYNPYVNEYLTYKSQLKSSLADYLSKQDKLIMGFGDLIKGSKSSLSPISLSSMQEVKNILAECFDGEDLQNVKNTIIQLSDKNLESMIEEYAFLSEEWTSKIGFSLIFPSMFNLLTCCSGIAGACQEKLEVYIDDFCGHEKVIKEFEKICKNNTLIRNVTRIEACNSEGEILIQAADLLCGYLSRLLRDLDQMLPREEDVTLWKKLWHLHELYGKRHFIIWDCVAHSDFSLDLAKLLGGEIDYADEALDVIIRDFNFALKSR